MPSLLSSLWGTNKNEDKSQKPSKELFANLSTSERYILGIMTSGAAFLLFRKFGKRIQNSGWVSPNDVSKKRWIKGVVTSVGDADNFRLYHTPVIGYNWPFRFKRIPTLRKDLTDETIHVRLAGVDAPEGTYFGKPGQPYHTEALEWLRKQILGKKVYCQLLRKDQYERIVAHVHLPHFVLPGLLSGKNIAAEIVKAGWAVTYDQAGAEYGQLGQEGYLKLEKEAKRKRRGMWKDGTDQETPAAYKRRHTQSGQTTKPTLASGPVRSRLKKNSWF